MILEEFSKVLQEERNRDRSPERVLSEWLLGYLLVPADPADHVGRVLHTEIALLDCDGNIGFEGKSRTGRQLLNSLQDYCRSFDHWQFTRWLHHIQATDFPVG